jgi:hypothetical protein
MTRLANIKSRIKKAGYEINRTQCASTGSVYIYIERKGVEVTVRVGDHAEMYPPAIGHRQISISPQELTVAQALRLLADPEANIKPYYLTDEEIAEKKRWQEIRSEKEKAKIERYELVRSIVSEEDFARAKKHHNMNVCREIAAKYEGVNAGLLKSAAREL